MRSNLTPVYVFMLLGAFVVGLLGTLFTARSLLPAPSPARPSLQQPTGLPLPAAAPTPPTTEC